MKRWIFILTVIGVLSSIIVWRFVAKSADTAQQAKQREARLKAPPSVTVTPAGIRDIVHTFTGVGTVEAPLNAKIASRATGRIEYLQLREGDVVHAGKSPDVLVRIDPSQLLAQVSQQEASLAEARSRLAQAQMTQNPTNVSVTTQISQQEAGLRSSKADLEQAKQLYSSQMVSAQSAIVDAQARVDTANSAILIAQVAVKNAQANVDNARVRFNRTTDLYKQGFTAPQDVDDARTTMKVQEGGLEGAQGQLNSARTAHKSALTQLDAAKKQYDIVVTKGKSDVAAAQAKVDQAEAALKYARSNTAQMGAYKENLAALRANMNAAQAQLDNAKSQLSETVLTAPMDGVVTARYFDPGSVVSPGQPILVIQDIRKVFVTVSVPEELSRMVTVGKAADVTFDGLPGRQFRGTITYVTPASDPQSRQFAVRVTLDNPQSQIRPGMFARVSFVTDREAHALVVPREAVLQGKDGPSVVVVDAGSVAHRKKVRTGGEDAAGIAILSGVQPGDKVITLGGASVKDGQEVKVNSEAQPGEGAKPLQGGGARNTP